MALTKVQTIGIETGISLTGVTTVTTLNASTDTLSVGGTVNFGGNVSIAGTLTYEDVTNIDAVGLITARNGIKVDDLGVQVGTGATVDSAADNVLTFLTNGGERLRIASDGKLSITGSTANMEYLRMGGNNDRGLRFTSSSGSSSVGVVHTINAPGDSGSQGEIVLQTNSAERLRIDSSGRLLKSGQASLTSTSLNHSIQVAAASDANAIAIFGRAADDIAELSYYEADKSTKLGEIQYRQDHVNFRHRVGDIRFATAGTTERMRIDSSGRLLIGTDTSPSAGQGQYSKLVSLGGAGTSYGNISFGHTSAATSLSSGDNVALVCFTDNAGNVFSRIDCAVDAAPGSNDYPGRLIISTTADGASSPTERLRIDSAGTIKCGTSSTLKAEINNSVSGHQFISQCSDNNNGFEVYQQHGSNTTRNTFAVYANTGSGSAKNLQFSIRGDGCVTKPTNPLLKTNMGATYGGNASLHSGPDVSILQSSAEIDKGSNGWTTSGSNAYTFVCPVAGVYAVHAHFSLDDITQGNRVIFAMAYTDGGGNLPLSSYVELMDTNVDDYQNYSYYNTWSFSAGTRVGFGINTTGSGGTLTGFNSQWGIHLLQ